MSAQSGAASPSRRRPCTVSRDPSGLIQRIFRLPCPHSSAGGTKSSRRRLHSMRREAADLRYFESGGVMVMGVVTGQSALRTACSPAVAPVPSPASVFPDGNAPGVVAQPASTTIITHREINSPIPRVCMTSLSFVRVGCSQILRESTRIILRNPLRFTHFYYYAKRLASIHFRAGANEVAKA